MDGAIRKEILLMSRKAHDWTEQSYRENSAARGDAGWEEKQRVLLADMALHLLQTALREDDLSEEHLKRNLFSILTISDQFIQGHDLKAMAEVLYGA